VPEIIRNDGIVLALNTFRTLKGVQYTMFIVANIINGVAIIFATFLQIYMFILIGRVLISWVDADPRNQIVRFLYKATEPLLSKVRKYLPFLITGSLDLTPLAVLALIYFLQFALVGSLQDLALSLRG